MQVTTEYIQQNSTTNDAPILYLQFFANHHVHSTSHPQRKKHEAASTPRALALKSRHSVERLLVILIIWGASRDWGSYVIISKIASMRAKITYGRLGAQSGDQRDGERGRSFRLGEVHGRRSQMGEGRERSLGGRWAQGSR